MTDDRPTTDRAETALLELLADHPLAEIRLAAIAERAGVSLADLRAAYDGPLDILSGFARRIDVAVLAGDDPSMAGESRRERLLDALMRRFDLLAPHRAGLAGLRRSARRDPVLAVHLGRLVIGSQAWILEAAGISSGGLLGRLRAPVLAAALARLAPTFLADEGEGLPKTMAALDAMLADLERLERRARGVLARVPGCRPRAAEAPAEAPEPAAEANVDAVVRGFQ